jgi:hypothetical protein
MSQQLAFNLAGMSVGLIAALCFCIGSVLLSVEDIADLATSKWGFNSAVVHSLAAQRGLSVTGALLLLISFGLQVLGAVASSTNPADLPQALLLLSDYLLLALVLSGLLACGIFGWIYTRTKGKALQLLNKQEK